MPLADYADYTDDAADDDLTPPVGALSVTRPDTSGLSSVYDTAIQRLKASRTGEPSRAEKLLAISAALGAPTRTGTLGETFGNLSKTLGETTAAAREARQAREDRIAELEFKKAQDLQQTQSRFELAKMKYAAANTPKPINPLVETSPTGTIYRHPKTREVLPDGYVPMSDGSVRPATEVLPGYRGTPAPAAPTATKPTSVEAKDVPEAMAQPLGALVKLGGAYYRRVNTAEGLQEVKAGGQDTQYGDLTGPDLLAKLTPSDRARVQALYEGRILAPTAGTRDKEGARLLALVSQAYPDFDASVGKTKFKTRQDYGPSGNVGKNIASFNTAIGHLDSMNNAVDKLGNYSGLLTPLNPVKNFVASNTGNPQVNNFKTARSAVADELVRAFRMTGGSLTEVQDWQNRFDAAASPEQLKGAVKEATDLLGSRIDALVQPYNQTMGTNRSFLSFMTPKSRATLLKLNPELQLTEDDKAFLADESRKAQYKAELDRRRATPSVAKPATATGTLPPAAVAQLKPGRNTTFANGQVWTIDASGKPRRVN